MKILALLVIISIICLLGEAKTVRKTIRLSNFNKEGPFIFLTKLHIGAGYGQVDLTYTYSSPHAEKETKSHPNNCTTLYLLESLIKLVSASSPRLLHVCRSSSSFTKSKKLR